MKMIKFYLVIFLLIFSIPIYSQIPQNYFIKNTGQWDQNIKYALLSNNFLFYFTKDALYFDYFYFKKSEELCFKNGNVMKFVIEGSKFDEFLELIPSTWKLNFFFGNYPKKWTKEVQGFEKIQILNILPNIDMILTFSTELRYDFVVHARGNPESIKIKLEGAKIFQCKKNEITFKNELGEIIHRNLFVYQNNENKKSKIDASFKYIDENTFGFEVKNYDKTKDLIIDPLVLSTLIGGSNSEEIIDLVETTQGSILVTGWTESLNFPTTPGTYSRTYAGEKDIFISKLNVKGSKRELVFSTLIGGSSSEIPVNVLVDNSNNVYVGATSNSNDLPLVNAMSKSSYGFNDSYICKFNPECSEILFATYFGGSKDDILASIKLSGDNGVYLVGYSNSPDLPVTGGAYQGKLKGKNDIFFAKISNTGQAIRTCTYIGGIEDDFAYDMCVSPSEYVYIGGATKSNDFPAFPVRVQYYGPYEYVFESPFDRTYNGNFDGVVIKIFGASGGLEYASFFGGLADDFVTTVGYFGTDERVVFAGKTIKEPSTTTFPLTQTAYQNSIKGQEEAFVASLSNINTRTDYGWTYKSQNLNFSTFLGGSGTDVPTSITFNKNTQTFYIVGYTSSTNFPIVNNPSGKKFLKNDIFFVSMLCDGSGISYSNILGGNDDDYPNVIFLNYAGDYYIAGKTNSTNFPIVNPIKDISANAFPKGFILKNVDATLRFEAPFGNEEFCPKSKVTIKWGVEGITQQDSFDVEIRPDNSNEWILVASNVKELSTTITLADDITGKLWIRVSHPKGLIATIQTPIIILEPPKIISFAPENEYFKLCEGDSIKFSVSSKGSKLKYQWKFNDFPIEGATDTILSLGNLRPSNSGKYKVSISGTCPPNIESKEVTLKIIPKTKTISQSKDTIIKLNEDLDLYVQCEGENLKYQWYKNDSRLLGERNKTLKITKVTRMDEGSYFCIIEGDCGTDTSKTINVSVDTNISRINYSIKPDQLIISCSENKLQIKLPKQIEANDLIFKIYDILGNIVLTKEIISSQQNEFHVDISNLTIGPYVLTLQTEKEFFFTMFNKH